MDHPRGTSQGKLAQNVAAVKRSPNNFWQEKKKKQYCQIYQTCQNFFSPHRCVPQSFDFYEFQELECSIRLSERGARGFVGRPPSFSRLNQFPERRASFPFLLKEPPEVPIVVINSSLVSVSPHSGTDKGETGVHV